MYEQSKHFCDFDIAGFQYWDGITVIDELKVGKPVKLVGEWDNPYDANAVAIYYGESKLGFVPRHMNSQISQLLYFGHGDVFEAMVSGVDLEEEPSSQVHVTVRMKDARPKV